MEAVNLSRLNKGDAQNIFIQGIPDLGLFEKKITSGDLLKEIMNINKELGKRNYKNISSEKIENEAREIMERIIEESLR